MTSTAADTFARFVAVLADTMDDHDTNGEALASRVHLSRFHCDRLVSAAAGEPPAALRRRILLERAAYQLITTDHDVLRVAVEAGWKRARNTCLAADAVSLLAAVVLYIFAAGVVRGFAFALGISTLIDLVVFFWFTHPMVSWLSQFRFFNQGHHLSGLDAEALGIDRINLGTATPQGQTVGGRA